MDAAQFLVSNPEIKHGAIKILFTPDEEIGRGVDKADLKKLGADFAYTMDGETAGHIEDETFSADGATITIEGVSTHPGFAKGKMEHAIKIASAIVDRLPKDYLLARNHRRQAGVSASDRISGALEQATLGFIVRDFTEAGIEAEGSAAGGHRPGRDEGLSALDLPAGDQAAISQHEAGDRSPSRDHRLRHGSDPPRRPDAGQDSIRGGTDGSRLSFMGLPCPNIFAGEHAFHSRLEWVSVQDMEKACRPSSISRRSGRNGPRASVLIESEPKL